MSSWGACGRQPINVLFTSMFLSLSLKSINIFKKFKKKYLSLLKSFSQILIGLLLSLLLLLFAVVLYQLLYGLQIILSDSIGCFSIPYFMNYLTYFNYHVVIILKNMDYIFLLS